MRLACYPGSIDIVKLSISLTAADVALLDQLQAQGGFPSRSAVVQHALARLRSADLQADYAEAWGQWQEEGDADLWESAAADGVPAKTVAADAVPARTVAADAVPARPASADATRPRGASAPAKAAAP